MGMNERIRWGKAKKWQSDNSNTAQCRHDANARGLPSELGVSSHFHFEELKTIRSLLNPNNIVTPS